MRPRQRSLEAITRLIAFTTLLGTIVTICAVGLADAAGLPALWQMVLIEGGAGLTALGAVALFDFFTLTWRS